MQKFRSEPRYTAEQLRGLSPLLLAAISAGAAIPSQALAERGIEIEFNWRKVNRFQAVLPIRITHSEGGTALPTLPKASHIPVPESDDDFQLKRENT
jgi:hypothetical protein